MRKTLVDGAEALAWSPDGGRIAVTTVGGVVILDGAGLTEIASQATDKRQLAAAFSDDGRILATADHWLEGQRLRLWDGETLTLFWEKDLPGDAAVRLLDFLPTGELQAVSSHLGGLVTWLITPAGTMTQTFEALEVLAQSAAVHPSKGWVAGTVRPPGHGLRVYNLSTRALLLESEMSPLVPEFARRRGVLLVDLGSSISVWDVEARREVTRVPVLSTTGEDEDVPFRISVSHDDGLFVTGTTIPTPGIGIWELESGKLVGLIQHDQLAEVNRLSFSPTEDELAILLDGGRLEIWEITR